MYNTVRFSVSICLQLQIYLFKSTNLFSSIASDRSITLNLCRSIWSIHFKSISSASSLQFPWQNQRSERRLLSSPKVAPWLVTLHGKYCKFQTFYSISENPSNKSYKKFISELSGKRFWQKNCHQGWSIIADRPERIHPVSKFE